MKEPGVFMFQGRIICYDCSGDWIQAVELGSPDPLPITPDLSRAIHEDLARGRRKATEWLDDYRMNAASAPKRLNATSPGMVVAESQSLAGRSLLRRRA